MLLTPDQSRALFRHAVENRYAVLAVNADSPAAIVDCLEAAAECNAPIIIETSLWQLTGRSFGAGDPLLGIDRYLADLRCLAESERFRDVPVVYHTDHIKGPDTARILKHAIARRASSVSLDSSELSHEENIALMSELCAFVTENDLPVSLEMEAGVDDGVTPIEEAETLFGAVERAHPGCLALWAPGVGTKHGLGAADGFDATAVRKHREAASSIAGRPIGIALHGSSGMSNDDLRAAVEAGVAKVNWSSESLLIRSGVACDYYEENADRLAKSHPDFKTTAMDNGVQSHVSKTYIPRVIDRIRTLNGTGFGIRFLENLF